MNASSPIRIFLKRCMWLMAVIILLTAIVAGTVWYQLSQHGITFAKASFTFPSTLRLHDLAVNNNAVTLRAGLAEVQWSWSALLQGDIEGDFLTIANASIEQGQSAPGDTAASTLPSINFGTIRLQNTSLLLRNDADSSALFLHHVKIKGFHFNDSLRIDSLINEQSNFTGSYAKHLQDSTTQSSPFSLSSLPQFSIGYINFEDCDFAVHYDGQRYSIDKLGLRLSGLNNQHMMDISLHELHFQYQDSLDVHLELDKLTVNNQRDAVLNNVSLELPGLKLATSTIKLSDSNGPALKAQFEPSYFNTDLLLFFFPLLEGSLPRHTQVNFHGGLTYHNDRIGFEKAQLMPESYGSFIADGFFGYDGMRDSIALDITSLHTSSRKLAKWFGTSLPSVTKDFSLRGHLTVAGTYDHLHSSGQASLANTPIRYTASIDQTTHGQHIQGTLHSPIVSVSDFVSGLDSNIILTDASLTASTSLTAKGLQNLTLRLDGDSLFTGTSWMDAPHAYVAYSPHKTVATLQSDIHYQLTLETSDDVLRKQVLAFAGKIDCLIPSQARAPANTGRIHSIFRGKINQQEKSRSLTLMFDTLRVDGKSLHHPFITSGNFELAEQPDQTLKTSITLGDEISLQAVTGRDIVDWFSASEKLTTLPTASIQLRATIDSTLVRQLTGEKGNVNIQNATIQSTTGALHADVAVNTLQWMDYTVSDFTGNFHYDGQHVTSNMKAVSVATPYTLLDQVGLQIDTQRDSVFMIGLQSFLPEVQQSVGLCTELSLLPDGYRIGFGGKDLQFGSQHWDTQQSTYLQVNRAFDLFSGKLVITNNQQRLSLEGNNQELHITIDSLDIHPLTSMIAPEPKIVGSFNGDATCNIGEQRYAWSGKLHQVQIDTVLFGDMHFDGKTSPGFLEAHAELHHSIGDFAGTFIRANDSPIRFDMKLDRVDLRKVAMLLPMRATDLNISGFVNGKIEGTYDETLNAIGYVAFPDAEIKVPEYDLYFKVKNDSVILKGSTMQVNRFALLDRRGRNIMLSGGMNFLTSALDLSLQSDGFAVLDKTQDKAALHGSVDMACNVHVSGSSDRYSVTGKLSTLPGAAVTYLYKSGVNLDDRAREIEFVQFNNMEKSKAETSSRTIQHSTPINWNVEIDVGAIDATILFSETTQEHIKTTAEGKVHFKTGNSAVPFVFGSIESRSGDIVYHTPLISDIHFDITRAAIHWTGDINQPLISFSGSELFRLTPNEISSTWPSKTDRWPLTVIATIDDRPLNDLDLNLDLESTNSQVADWIRSLPPDTRQANAIALLVRGKINNDATTEANPYMSILVSKMNEIASRNVKSADISFYDDSNSKNPDDATGTANKLGYSLSRKILNKKVRLSLGGNVDLSGGSSNTLSNIKLEYVLHENPTITLQTSRASIYTGVIDGTVEESSFGITYVKRFRNFLYLYRKKKKA